MEPTQHSAAHPIFYPSRPEPVNTIYTSMWRQAREQAVMMEDPAQRKAFMDLFNYVEQGWLIIRPLQLVAEGFLRRKAVNDVADFIFGEVTERVRWFAEEPIALMPEGAWRQGWVREADWRGPDDILPQVEGIVRNLRILEMAEAHPSFPSEYRGKIGPAVLAIQRWMARVDELEVAAIQSLTSRDEGENADQPIEGAKR